MCELKHNREVNTVQMNITNKTADRIDKFIVKIYASELVNKLSWTDKMELVLNYAEDSE